MDGTGPDRLIGHVPENQRGHSRSQAGGGGTGATVVDDRAALGKDGRIVDQADTFHVVGMTNAGGVGCRRIDQGSLAELCADIGDHGERLDGRLDGRAAEAEVDGWCSGGDPRLEFFVGFAV
ncbi:Uncharacterised protein [Mycobacterium tuberculosis]|uniref:Uncharacterized protein n=1 Tax=Mycobacterium tuberculosis TaxID=1773 RepID=A0A916PAV5_MYCTX|nr:Uncharacterised protein [Mycobacterium tuberculosis]COY58630.1 Uncharacterised protein [Mycobacterium tuberculosis]COZ01508.1 Uncharacterised protein [Mycobacterium tuberculosis]